MARTVRQSTTASQQQLSDNIDDLGSAIEDFKERHIAKQDDLEDRIGCVEADANARQFQRSGGSSGSKEGREFLQAVITRSPQMAVTIGTGSQGGNAAPEHLSNEVQNMVRRLSPLVDLVTVEQSTTGQYAKIVTDIKHASGWADEGDTRSESVTATVNKVSPTYGTVYSYPKASEESIQDIEAFNVERWFVEESGRAFAAALGAAIVSGNGTARPTGILNGSAVSPQTIVSTVDEGVSPERAFGSIQYLPTGAAADFQQDRLGSPQGDPAGVFFDTLYALNEDYRSQSTWAMNSLTLAKVRKFRDSSGQYIFQPGLISGMDDQLLGRPVRVCEDVPGVAANAFVAILADFKRAYTLVQVGPIRVTYDDVTSAGQVKLYVRQRVGGKVMDSNAVKVIKAAVS